MKRFKVNKFLYSLFPVFIILIAAGYYNVLLRHSYFMTNIINLTIDGILIIIYFYKFCIEIRVDSTGVNFYTFFKRYRVRISDIDGLRNSSFLTVVTSERKSFYILTTFKGQNVLQDMFKNK